MLPPWTTYRVETCEVSGFCTFVRYIEPTYLTQSFSNKLSIALEKSQNLM